MEPATVLVVDDQRLMLQALKVFVSQAEDLRVVGEASNGVQAIERCAQLEPDVVLMDLQMPVLNGIDATRRITAAHPDIKVIAVTTFASPDAVVPALRAGASGYLLKDSEPEVLIKSIRDVLAGQNVLSPVVMNALVAAVRQQEPTPPPPELSGLTEAGALSERELAVIQLLAEGLSNAEMAAELCLSEAAVKSRLGQITAKLGVTSRVQVLVRACELGLVRPHLRRPTSGG